MLHLLNCRDSFLRWSTIVSVAKRIRYLTTMTLAPIKHNAQATVKIAFIGKYQLSQQTTVALSRIYLIQVP